MLVLSLASLGGMPLWAQKVDTLKVHQLQELSVVATRAGKTTPMSYSNIKRDELRRINLGQDVPYLLSLQPSVVATSDAGTGIGYTGIRVRGVDATGTNVTANGVPINDSESQGVFWVNMPDLVSSVEEMQLQRGVGTSSNGAGSFGASLNLRTSGLSTKPYGEVSLSGGSFETFRRNVRVGSGLIGGRWAADLRLSKIDSKGYIDRATVDLTSYFVQLGHYSDNTVLKFISFGGKEVTGIAWHGISQEQEAKYGRRYNAAGDMQLDGKRYYHNTDNYQQQHNHLIFTHRISPLVSLGITGHYTKGFGYTDEYRTGRKPSEYALPLYTQLNSQGKAKEIKRSLIRRKYLDNDFVGLITNLSYKPHKWDIALGLSANHYKGLHYGEVRWIESSFPSEVVPTDRYYDGLGYKLDLSAYAKASYSIKPNLSTYVDLQYRFVNYKLEGNTDAYSSSLNKMLPLNVNKDFNFFNPKVGIFWRFAPKHHSYASVAIAHREPNRKMYTDAGSQAELPRAEQMSDYELGYAYNGDRLRVGANLYYMHYSDQLVATGKFSDVGELLLSNIPDSYRMGLEMTLGYTPIDALRLNASLALSQNKVKDYTYYVGDQARHYSDSPLAYSPSVVASGAICYKGIRHIELSLTAQHVGKQYLDNTGSEDRSMPAYTLAGLRLAYERPLRGFLKSWSINLQINNLFDSRYYSNAYIYDTYLDGDKQVSDIRTFPQASINFLLGTSISF